MNRREMIELSGISVLASSMPSASFGREEKTKILAKDVNTYLRSLAKVKEPSVDRIIIGNPETEIKKIGTCWMPYWKTLKKAVADGVNLLIVHEPTFYTYWDLQDEFKDAPAYAREKYLQLRKEKAAWIEANHLVIIRCHDVEDLIPKIGIPFAFGNALGFNQEQIVRSQPYYNIYKIEPQPAIQVVRYIANKLKSLGQDGVQFYGDDQYSVKTIGVGTGCICDPMQFMELEPDMFIAIDDSIRTWTQTTYAEDSGRPLVVVNHGTSEEFGMRLLSNHLQEIYSSTPVVHFNQGCSYRWIPGEI